MTSNAVLDCRATPFERLTEETLVLWKAERHELLLEAHRSAGEDQRLDRRMLAQVGDDGSPVLVELGDRRIQGWRRGFGRCGSVVFCGRLLGGSGGGRLGRGGGLGRGEGLGGGR